MKLRKTPLWQRDTYTYRFDNGDWSVVSVGKVTSFHDGTISVSNDASITKEVISNLHKLDDKEVRENLRTINFEDRPMMKERIAKKKQWDKEHPNEENPYDKPPKVIYLNKFTPDATLDMIDNFLYHNSLVEEDEIAEKERIEELRKQVEDYVSTLYPSMQELYQLLYVQGMSQKEICEKLNLAKNTVSQRKKVLERKIFKKFS